MFRWAGFTRAGFVLGLLVFGGSVVRAAQFDFESVVLGTSTPLSLTNGGLTVTFSSPDPGVFVVGNSFFSALVGKMFYDADSAFHTLGISFSAPINYLQFNFALDGAVTTQLNYSMFTGGLAGTLVGSGSATGTIPGGFTYPEGLLSLSGLFDAVQLTATAQDFAIDNLSTIPEPGMAAVILAGAAFGAAWYLRNRV